MLIPRIPSALLDLSKKLLIMPSLFAGIPMKVLQRYFPIYLFIVVKGTKVVRDLSIHKDILLPWDSGPKHEL